MTPERFTDWLQGFVEIQDAESITDTQWLVIKDHLKLVFDKKTPDRSEKELVDFLKKDLDKPTPLDLLYGRPKPVDLVGKQFEWMFKPFDPMNPPVITC